MEKTYKLRGVEFMVNEFGFLVRCSDWESVRGNLVDCDNSDLFRKGLLGGFYATELFWEEAEG